jgi:dipeptidyl aminopeptidase/acylaminoacyl peptidase
MTRMFSLATRALVVLLLSTCAAVAQESLPLETFTRSDELGTMKISPDGEYLALTTGQHGGEYLTFLKLGDPRVGASVRAPEGLLIHDFYWASNTRVIFMIAEQYPGDAFPAPTGEIYAVDRDGRKQLRVYGYRAGQVSTSTILRTREASYASAEVVSLLDGDDRNILISEMPWRLKGMYYFYDRDAKPGLTRLDIYNGSKQHLDGAPLANATVIVDRDDQPRFAIGMDDGGHLSVAWKRTPDVAWEAFDLPGYRAGTVLPQRFTPDNRSVLFTAVPEGERYAALFQLELAERAVKKLIDAPDADVLDLVNDFQSNETIGVLSYTDKLVYRWLLPDHPAARTQQAVQRAFEGNEVSFISHSADGRRAIVFVQSDVAPGEYFLFDTQTKKADMIMAARQWIDLKKMRPKEPVSIKARDGLPLHGYLTRPAGNSPSPLVVLPHGGPHGIRDEWGFDTEVQLLASRGYAVLQVNFRGSGGYGTDFEVAGYRQWGAKMQDDLTDATRWAIEQKIAPPERICIYGASYGGYAALMGIAREPNLYRCAIGFAGVYDLELMLHSGDIPRSKLGLDYLDLALGSDLADLRARSPVNSAASITAPVLLIHGKEDWRADYRQAIRMKTALEKAGKPVEWVSLSGEGHGVYDDRTRLEVYETILKFLDTHLMTPSSAAN